MSARRSLYHEYPDYRVDIEPSGQTVRVGLGGELLAETHRAVTVRESKHAPVTYLPLEDVRADLIEPTDHTTFCPFKGDASYWTVRVADRVEENVLWGYEKPFPEVAGLVGYVAFYPDRVEWEIEEGRGEA